MESNQENKKMKFSEAEKRRLISAVKKKNLIWNKADKLHSNRNAMKAAWREIANGINKPDDACRQNWKSILDSKRYYRQRRKVPNKSGSACDLEIISDDCDDPWEFSEDLEFLTETSNLRTTSSSQLLCSPCFDSPQDMIFDASDLSQTSTTSQSKEPEYSYKKATSSKKNLYLNEMRAGVLKVAEVMTKLVDIAGTQKETSENTSFLNYIDSLMQKLPKVVAEDMQSNIIKMLLDEISKQRLNDQIEANA